MICTLLLWLLYVGSNNVERAVAVGDSAFNAIDYAEAIAVYEAGLKEHAHEPQLLWRLSRSYVTLGEASPDEDKEPLFRKAELYARKCIEVDERNAKGHTGLAAALGSIALISNNKTKVRLSQEIKRGLLRAIELDSTDYVPRSILGSYYRELGNLTWFERTFAKLLYGSLPAGGYAESETELKKAVSLAPHVMRNHYELGLTYKAMGKGELAIHSLRHALVLPVMQASDRLRLGTIPRILAELQK